MRPKGFFGQSDTRHSRRIGAPPLTWASSYSAMAKELILNETTLDEARVRLNDYWTKLF